MNWPIALQFPRTRTITRTTRTKRRLFSTSRGRTITRELRVGMARSREDLEAAFRLLQWRYESVGLSQSGGTSLRILPYHVSPASQVFNAYSAGKVVGTVTLVQDSIEGLPIASSYPQAIEALSRTNRIGEITSLAVDPSHGKPGKTFAELTRLLTFFARAQGLRYLAAVVHPRHAKFYQHAMGFDVIGEERRFAPVCGKPGIAVLGSVNDSSRFRPRWKDYYFNGDFTARELRPNPISDKDRQYFMGK